jgi:septal ring factor EnvC (AmiA/AmiB activator)
MSNQISTTIIMCIIFGLFSFYYFNKFQESEKEYTRLHKKFDEIYIENQKMKSRIKDLQSYKDDVSKTMKILDNELVLINNHLQKQNVETAPRNSSVRQRQSRMSPYLRMTRTAEFPRSSYNSNNISLLSTELLSSLFNNMNQENYQAPNLQQSLVNENVEQNQQNQSNQSNQELNQPQMEKNDQEEKQDISCESLFSNVIEDNKTNIENNINDESFSNLQPNEKIININYDISYTPNQSSYEQYLIDKEL